MSCPKYSLNQALKEKTEKEYSPEALEVIDAITVQEHVLPVGSSIYSVHKYPGDIDIFEHLEFCCAFNEARLQASQQLQNIVEKLTEKDFYIADFKAGIDERFRIYIGLEKNHEIIDYNPHIIRD